MMREERDPTDLGLSPAPVEPAPIPAAHKCRGGWLPEGPAGEPRPCLVCRPWLAGGVR